MEDFKCNQRLFFHEWYDTKIIELIFYRVRDGFTILELCNVFDMLPIAIILISCHKVSSRICIIFSFNCAKFSTFWCSARVVIIFFSNGS